MFGFRYTAVFGLGPYAKSYCEPCGKFVSLKCPLALSSFSIFSSVTSTHFCGGHNLGYAPKGGYYCFKVLSYGLTTPFGFLISESCQSRPRRVVYSVLALADRQGDSVEQHITSAAWCDVGWTSWWRKNHHASDPEARAGRIAEHSSAGTAGNERDWGLP